MHLFDLAQRDMFDRAIILSNDSDFVPVIKMVRSRFPEKHIMTLGSPGNYTCTDLIKVSNDKAKIQLSHLEKCQLEESGHTSPVKKLQSLKEEMHSIEIIKD